MTVAQKYPISPSVLPGLTFTKYQPHIYPYVYITLGCTEEQHLRPILSIPFKLCPFSHRAYI
jgi:hypothetical protein